MSKLYEDLAVAYHEMYQSIFDYRKEFQFYHRLLKKHGGKKILEIGCGSGNLTAYFLKAGYDYTGLDLATGMLRIARKLVPEARFVKGDMRSLRFKEKFDAVLITGRSFTYMTTNDDVERALNSVNKVLKKNGILIFDNFDAAVIFADFKKRFVQSAQYKTRQYRRVSENTKNLKTGWTWNWNATYYITEKGKKKVIEDKSILRGFTKDELELFLKLNNFDILKMRTDGSALTTIAKKH